jgi:hypothetical protein
MSGQSTTIRTVDAVDSTIEAYERAERSYLDAVKRGAASDELALIARRVADSAREWQSAAYKQFFTLRDTYGEAARVVISMEIDAEKAELLSELWQDIAVAHEATAG